MAKQGGKRPGAGRKPKSKNKSTLEKEAVLKDFTQRVMRNANLLYESQFTLARGVTLLYKIEKELQIGPKGGKKYVRSKPILVTDPTEIANYIDGSLEDGDAEDENDPNSTYYYITTEKPDGRAIDSMLDRALGKAINTIAGADGGPIQVTVVKYAQPKKKA